MQDKTAVLEITLDHMDQGLMMFDEHGTVQVCIRRAIVLDLSAELMTAKPTFAAVREYQLRSGEFDNETEAFRSWVRTSGFEGKHQVYESLLPQRNRLGDPNCSVTRRKGCSHLHGYYGAKGCGTCCSEANGVIDF